VGNYDTARIVSWHRAMGQHLKDMDPYGHLVAAHYTANRLDPMVEALPQIDVAQSTGYFADMVDRLSGMYFDHCVFGKPVYLNEFGVGDSHNELRHNLHAGLWVSSVMPFCGAALFWWWPYIHEKNEYYQYANIARFHAGEDYRGRDYQRSQMVFLGAAIPDALSAVVMQNRESARAWIYDPRIYRVAGRRRTIAPPAHRPIPASRWSLGGLRDGRYRIEFWDTWRGRPVLETVRPCDKSGELTFEAPPFEADMAVKIDRVP
jgi:hypothetical protein